MYSQVPGYAHTLLTFSPGLRVAAAVDQAVEFLLILVAL